MNPLSLESQTNQIQIDYPEKVPERTQGYEVETIE
jgi:hypothetical protein